MIDRPGRAAKTTANKRITKQPRQAVKGAARQVVKLAVAVDRRGITKKDFEVGSTGGVRWSKKHKEEELYVHWRPGWVPVSCMGDQSRAKKAVKKHLAAQKDKPFSEPPLHEERFSSGDEIDEVDEDNENLFFDGEESEEGVVEARRVDRGGDADNGAPASIDALDSNANGDIDVIDDPLDSGINGDGSVDANNSSPRFGPGDDDNFDFFDDAHDYGGDNLNANHDVPNSDPAVCDDQGNVGNLLSLSKRPSSHSSKTASNKTASEEQAAAKKQADANKDSKKRRKAMAKAREAAEAQAREAAEAEARKAAEAEAREAELRAKVWATATARAKASEAAPMKKKEGAKNDQRKPEQTHVHRPRIKHALPQRPNWKMDKLRSL
ncbi:hypothetical protein CF326_g8861 [Tilletia indica]|nr:hypothetical protein CF326_g8861 [Tilletia indica]